MVDQEEELLQMAIQQSLMDQEQRQQQLALAGVEGGGEVCMLVRPTSAVFILLSFVGVEIVFAGCFEG